jgi:hypothetical protein
MSAVKSIATGAVIAGSLGMAALGFGSGLANAAPSPGAPGTSWAQWGPHGPGYGPGWGRGSGWGPPPPPPPPPAYGYGGYGYGAPVDACVNGPLGLVHVCV